MWCLVLGDERPSCLAQGFKSSGERSQLQWPFFAKAWLIFSLRRFSLWYGMGCWGKGVLLSFMCRVICLFEIHCLMLVTKMPKLVAEMWERAAFWNLITCVFERVERMLQVLASTSCFSLASSSLHPSIKSNSPGWNYMHRIWIYSFCSIVLLLFCVEYTLSPITTHFSCSYGADMFSIVI